MTHAARLIPRACVILPPRTIVTNERGYRYEVTNYGFRHAVEPQMMICVKGENEPRPYPRRWLRKLDAQ